MNILLSQCLFLQCFEKISTTYSHYNSCLNRKVNWRCDCKWKPIKGKDSSLFRSRSLSQLLSNENQSEIRWIKTRELACYWTKNKRLNEGDEKEWVIGLHFEIRNSNFWLALEACMEHYFPNAQRCFYGNCSSYLQNVGLIGLTNLGFHSPWDYSTDELKNKMIWYYWN